MDNEFKKKLTALPKEAGVYLMKNGKASVIYVGKAKSLKSRVSSYFINSASHTPKTKKLVSEICDFDVIITKTEVEALLLERTLIKHHQPPFNILLRDDKEYPYIKVDMKSPWPRIFKVRKRRDDNSTYIGPYGEVAKLNLIMAMMYRIFPLIRCSKHEFDNTKRPCNYYHMKMCLAPCVLDVDKDEYKAMIQDAIKFLQGKNRELIGDLRKKMKTAAQEEKFELAATFRDQLAAFDSVSKKQSIIVKDVINADVFGVVQNDTDTSFHVLTIRERIITESNNFISASPIQDTEQALVEFLLQYYDSREVPRDVYLPFDIDEQSHLDEALSSIKESKVQTIVPKRGAKHDLVDMAIKNAKYQIEEHERLGSVKRIELEVLKEKLELPRLPRRMECIDISNLQEEAMVASNVCFIDGKPSKENYRHYNIKTVEGAPDDYGSIHEVVSRRIRRGLEESNLPDLLVIDGGKGQLGAAMSALGEYKGLELEIVSIAKSRVDKKRSKAEITSEAVGRSFERVFFPHKDTPLVLAPASPEFRLLTHIRDEAHRFAITHHRKKRSKAAISSELENIPGIGPAMRKKLLVSFGSLDAIKKASLDELKEIKGLRENSAVALYSFFRSDQS